MKSINEKAFIKTVLIILIVVIIILIIGVGIYINFIKNEDVNNNKNINNDNTGIPRELKNTEYKTIDSKYSIKITEDEKVYLNEKEIKEQKSDRIIGSSYMQIFGDFMSSSNHNVNMTFVLDKVNKVIMEQPIYEPEQEDINAFGEFAKFSARNGLKLFTTNNMDFMTFKDGSKTVVYTASWKKLGYLMDNVNNDTLGIYVCNSYDDNLKCIKEVQYDVDGNILN